MSRETGLLEEWPAEGPRLVWQRNDLGDGYSTPALVGKRIYLMSNQGMEDGAYAFPVIANGRLYIRNRGTLWAFDIKASR
jgi:hypothetical protein